MLQQALNIETNLRIAPESTWFDDAKSGNFDILIGVIVSSLLDPSDYFRAWYSADGPQNYAFWNNPRFDETLLKIDREVDGTKRLAHIREASYNYVKGLKP